jgi:predicted YcjX-like family ATPase
MKKTYTEEEINDLKKALYKAILKSLKNGKKDIAQEVVRDVLDNNYTAQVDPDKIPATQRENVVNKSKSAETQEKGVFKLKKFMKKKGKC